MDENKAYTPYRVTLADNRTIPRYAAHFMSIALVRLSVYIPRRAATRDQARRIENLEEFVA